MAGKSKAARKKRDKTKKRLVEELGQKKATTGQIEVEPEELGNNAEPPPPNVNEDAQKDEAMMADLEKPFDPMSIVNKVLRRTNDTKD